jgi:hypothetical protein
MFGIGTTEIVIILLIVGIIVARRTGGLPPVRFSLQQMMIAITVVAVLLGVLALSR